MPNLRRQSNGKLLTFTKKIGGGGEGDVYEVPNDPSLVAKVYLPGKLSGKGQKLKAMLANPPANPTKSINHDSIAWPIDLLLNSGGQVAGYLMPKAAQGMEKIFGFYVPPDRQQNYPGWTYVHLLSTASNLASAVSALHKYGYVIGDVNESNIMVKDTSLVTLIDTDSFQVTAQNGQVYRSEVGKEEFTPPELQGVTFNSVNRTPEHDLFGLGVLIYQLLMEGAHPFDGKYLGTGNPPTIGERINQGHFPYSKIRSVPFDPKPIAPPLAMLSPAIQQLFLKCFDEGHRNPKARPPAWTWHNELKNAMSLNELVQCPSNKQHHYYSGLANCPWCERAAKLGVDFFSPASQTKAKSQTKKATKKKTARQAAQQTVPLPQPAINYFRASNNSITAGQTIILSWDVANAQSVSIIGVGNFGAQGSTSVNPMVNTTYVIEARNGPHLVTSSTTIAVAVQPVINHFRASSNSITAGQSLTLSWDVANTQSVTIPGVGNFPAQGSVSVSPMAIGNATYAIEARNGPYVATGNVVITVAPPPPTINYFRASSNTIIEGQSLMLSWDVTHAQSVNISNGIGSVPAQGSVSVSPMTNTTYVIEARDSKQVVTNQIAITVKPAPVDIALFQTSSNAIHIGQSVKLQWQVNHAHTVEIDNDIGVVSQQGSLIVHPSADTTYTLTAKGRGGKAESQIKVEVSNSLMHTVSLDSPNVALNNPIELNRQTIKLQPVNASLLSPQQLSTHVALNPVSAALLKPVPLFRPVVVPGNRALTALQWRWWRQRFGTATTFLGRFFK